MTNLTIWVNPDHIRGLSSSKHCLGTNIKDICVVFFFFLSWITGLHCGGRVANDLAGNRREHSQWVCLQLLTDTLLTTWWWQAPGSPEPLCFLSIGCLKNKVTKPELSDLKMKMKVMKWELSSHDENEKRVETSQRQRQSLGTLELHSLVMLAFQFICTSSEFFSIHRTAQFHNWFENIHMTQAYLRYLGSGHK